MGTVEFPLFTGPSDQRPEADARNQGSELDSRVMQTTSELV
jgi:hypothetical protein